MGSLIVASLTATAQVSVHDGSGTNPDNSSMFDIQSGSKGALLPRVALTGVNDAATIASPATSLLVYNTSSSGGLSPGYYYNSGTSGSPVWMRLMSGNTAPIDGTGAANRVTYWSGPTTLTSSGNFIYGTTGNLSVFNAEATTGEVRLGAAWGRPGVYSTTALNLFTAAAQNIIFGNNNVEYMRLTSTGNLGIGATPLEALEIFRNGSNPVQLFHSSGVASYKLGNDGNVFKIAAMDNGYGGSAGNFATNDVQVLSMTTTGNVGIGNVAPNVKLNIGEAIPNGHQYVYLRSYGNEPASWKGGAAFGYTSASVIIGQLSNVATIGGHAADLNAWADLALNPAAIGNVGVGLSNPGAKLTVRSGGTDPGAYDNGKTLFASGAFGTGQTYDGGVEFRHDNLSQGIGFGYNTIYQTGTNANEVLNLIARGTGAITLNSYGGATGNVGIGVTAPQSKLHVMGKLNVHQSGAGGGQNRFEGLEAPTSANGRAQLVLSSAYSDLIVASSQANDNHGSTITLAAYDPGNANSYRKWVINQGNWGTRSQFLDFGYAVNIPNPHSAINSGNTTLTLDGVNRRVGINVISPSSKLEILHNTTLANGMYDQSNIEVVTNDASNPSIGFHRSGYTATALYHAGYGNNSLRIRNADGLDAALLHEGNMGTYGIQNQFSSAQSANFWISGASNVEGNYRLDGVEVIGNTGTDVYGNIRVLRSQSTIGDGMYLGYGGSGGPLRFFSNAGTTELMSLTTTGNLGIGTTAPVGKLHVGGNHANGVLADGNDRPSIAATGVYPQMVMMSGNSGNVNHGATLMIGGYDSGASGAHKHWAIGTSGQSSTFLDIGYHAGTDLNPHAGIRNYNGSTFMTILNTGNVGIGTLAPVDKLDVRSSMSVNEIKFRNLDGGDDTDPYRLRKTQSSSNVNELQLHLNDDSDERFGIYGNSCVGFGCGEYSGNLYHWFRADGNAFHSGRLGLGNQAPVSKLHVGGIASGDGIMIGNYNDQLGWNGSGGLPYFAIRFAGYRDVVSNFTGAMIAGVRTNLCCSGLSQAMDLSFFVQSSTATVGGDGNLVERARVFGNGVIATDYYYFSDQRLKENTRPIEYGLQKILDMNPVSYEQIAPSKFSVERDITLDKRSTGFGFIAQELQKVVPEIVNVPEDDQQFWSVSYGKLSPILVKAIQEQQMMIDGLTKQVEELQRRLDGK
jgi:hypothetical protein